MSKPARLPALCEPSLCVGSSGHLLATLVGYRQALGGTMVPERSEQARRQIGKALDRGAYV